MWNKEPRTITQDFSSRSLREGRGLWAQSAFLFVVCTRPLTQYIGNGRVDQRRAPSLRSRVYVYAKGTKLKYSHNIPSGLAMVYRMVGNPCCDIPMVWPWCRQQTHGKPVATGQPVLPLDVCPHSMPAIVRAALQSSFSLTPPFACSRTTVDAAEVAKFGRIQGKWWDVSGPCVALASMGLDSTMLATVRRIPLAPLAAEWLRCTA